MNFRSGEVSKPIVVLVSSVFLVGILFYLALRLRPETTRDIDPAQSLRIYCAAGIAKPVESVLEKYNDEFGTKHQIVRTGGSGELAGQIKTEFETGLAVGADLYITADDVLLDKARGEGIVAERFDLAYQRPVVATRKNDQQQFDDFESMVRSEGLRFGIASSRAAVGKLARKIAERDGFLDQLESNKVTEFENVMTLGQALVAGSIDAAILWDTTVSQINRNARSPDRLEIACAADPSDQHKSRLALGVIQTTTKPTQCLRFARYLTSAEKSQSAFEKLGFTFIAGDAWVEVPEIHLFCGSMFTPVIEKSVRDFATREGINLFPKWEGCGKLVTRIQLADGESGFPDAYFACDQMFLDKVEEHFSKPVIVSENDIVIAVRPGIAGQVTQLKDLMQDELRVGICDPQQSALGTLTMKMLENHPEEKFYSRLMAKSAVTVDVGPTLVSQLIAGGIDAALLYRSNLQSDPQTREKITVVEIDRKLPYSVASQPWAISRKTKYPRLMNRMFEWIQRDHIKKRFLESGFRLIHND